ncbi:hypothetical protein TrVE_jg9182 [Triparma verrucosa]|uniref:NADH:ubiquinone oxidoreductase intermediate-associated protein 30 domain-containing protein n=1 Tax=Triparma verrucosa TaxID=1606542 RepID=A0A9W7F2H6_9STRA|nr:hypothetical protein TrVE_jg9182 [Triparma verrucosa]
MGGVSSSRFEPSAASASDHWTFSGILRNDGGGFCGWRTKAFETPLDANGFEGVYLKVRFTSDDEPEKRTYKLTVRDDQTRGEYVRQGMFEVPKATGSEFSTVLVPFSSLVAVRGPVINPNAPPFKKDTVFQIGMVISKFKIAASMETIEDFRDGPFSMDISEVGFYSEENVGNVSPSTFPVMSNTTKSSFGRSVLGPVFKLVFSEKSRRRRAALNVLVDRAEKRNGAKKGLGRAWLQSVSVSYRNRARSRGYLSAASTFARRLVADSVKFFLGKTLKLLVFYPIFASFKLVKLFKVKVLGKAPVPEMK